ncbi:Hypothetical predicted protein [Mytilus galloprovincialis]|uniref:B box-type domain-containing protein n=1 Tax=Mytilus galloprovincialis TaxID=29158 RepID=A0A8B6GRS7_MYTGA|nr:Hypothetical predicted protein [Mytilus galloprovincialis]
MDICDICHQKRSIKQCENCTSKLCKTCIIIHQKQKPCLTLKSRSNNEYKYENIPWCSRHKKIISGYCTNCCTVVCKVCITEENHSVIGQYQTVQNIKGELQSMAKDLDIKTKELEQYTKLCNEREVKLNSVRTEIEIEKDKWTDQIQIIKQSLISIIEDEMKEIQFSYQEKHSLLTKAKSCLALIPYEKTSLRAISTWLQLRGAIDEFDQISHRLLMSPMVVFHAGYKNTVDLSKQFGFLAVDQVTDEKVPTPNNEIDDLVSRFGAVKIETNQNDQNETQNSVNLPSEMQECGRSMINILYNLVCDADRTDLHKDEKLLLTKNTDKDINQLGQQAKCIFEHVLTLRKACVEKDIEIKRLSLQYLNWTNEENANERAAKAEYDARIQAKLDRITIFENEMDSVELKIKNLETEKETLVKDMASLDVKYYENIKKVRQQHQVTLEAKKIEITKLKKRIDEEKEKHTDLTKQILSLNDKIKLKDQEIHNLKIDNMNIQSRFSAYVDPIQRQLQEKQDIENRLKTLLKEKDKQIAMLQKEKENITSLQQEKNEKIAAMRKEKEELQTRLSSIAGDKLTKGNPAITDLGDPNRPMKIGEKYGELYDNEWTDAMECIDEVMEYYPTMIKKEVEEIVIRHLYRLLMCCYRQCVYLSKEQLTNIGKTISTVLYLDRESNDDDQTACPCYKEIALTRRLNAHKTVKYFLDNQILDEKMVLHEWEYEHRNEKLITSLLKTSFFKQCLHLCWFIAIQDPMMHLDEDVHEGTGFDKNIYKEFVQSGNTVRYIVWPALFLHKNGPLLYKGVVQAYWQQK